MSDFKIENFNFAKYNTRKPQEILLHVCKEGNVQVVNWLIENYSGLIIDSNVFLSASQSGNIELLKLILSKNPSLNDAVIGVQDSIYGITVYDASFIIGLSNGFIDLCKWLLTYNKYIDVTLYNYQAFANACALGHLGACEWFAKEYPHLINSIGIERGFTAACVANKFNITSWLHSVKPNLDISYNNEETFTAVCISNNVNVAKALLNVKPDINIRVDNYAPIKAAISANSTDILNWLKDIKPEIFQELDNIPK